MMASFEGKTALVTGAASGIGKDLTHKLIELGANVIAVAQTQSKLDSLKSELDCDRLTVVAVNLGDWAETERKLGQLCKNVDFLVNNAGYAFCAKLWDIPKEEVDKTLDVNLKAPINLIKLVAPGMKERRFGSIVNVSSVASMIGVDDHLAYGVSKAGLDMVTKVGAKELGPFNIRVNSVNPTVVWTAMGRQNWSEPEKKNKLLATIPLGRLVEVREVVDPIIFLLGVESSMINGTLMPIDGGLSAT